MRTSLVTQSIALMKCILGMEQRAILLIARPLILDVVCLRLDIGDRPLVKRNTNLNATQAILVSLTELRQGPCAATLKVTRTDLQSVRFIHLHPLTVARNSDVHISSFLNRTLTLASIEGTICLFLKIMLNTTPTGVRRRHQENLRA